MLESVLLALALSAAPPDPTLPVCPAGFRVEVVARAPLVSHPSVVTCAPDGRVFVAEDPMDISLPKADLAEGRIVCFHPDGRRTIFAEKLHAVFGMQYLEGKLHVLHNPLWSVFRDEDGVGTDRQVLIERTNPEPWALNWNDHVPANFKLAMDGFFYVAVGDKGLHDAVGRDGKRIDLERGGILRLRPDGTELEVFAAGVRNILDVALTSEDEVFSYDNTDERDWWSRLAHMVDGGDYGYPYDFNPPRPWTLPPVADYGGGAATGTVSYEEDALPSEYRGNLFLADFGRRQVMRLRIEREGGTFRVVSREEDLLSGPTEFRPVGIDWAPDGLSLYVCDWNHLDTKEDVKVGRLLKVTWTGASQAAPKPPWFLPAAMGTGCPASSEDLVAGLRHPARSVRLTAQRRLSERGPQAAEPLARLLADDSAPESARWHALWALDGLAGGSSGRSAVLAALGDARASVRLQAARQLGLRRVAAASGKLVPLLADPSIAVRFHAASALGRIGDAEAVPALLEAFGEQDSFTRHALVTALERIGRARPEAWSRIAAGLGSPSDRIREGTLLVMRKTLEPEVVRALADFIAGRERPTEARAAALETLAGLHRKLPEWKGEWWGYHPVDRPPPMKTVDWSGTPAVLAALRDATGDPDPRLRSAALRGLREAGERAQLARLRDAFRDERDPEAQAEILTTLGALGDASAAGVLRSVLDDPGRERRVLLAAIDAARTLAAKDLVPSLAKLLHAKEPDPDVAVEAAGALGELGSAAAAPDLLRVLSSANERLRLTAIAALTQIGDGSRAPALMDLLGDPSAEVRRAAIRALGAWKAVGALPALLQAFEREETRFEAAGALALMPDARALDPYLFGITSASATLREDSRKALGAIAPATLPSIEARLLAGTLPPAALGPLRRIYAGVPQAASSELLNRPAKELSIPEYRDFALKTSGDPRRGRKLFEDQKGVACIKCHAAGGGPGGDLGPNLASIGAQYGRDHLAESILEPSKVVRDGYRQEIVALRTGDLLPGVVKSETPEGLVLQTADGEKRRLPRASIRERTASALSLMPEGLQAGLTLEEFADLVEYLASLRGPRRDGE